MADVTRSRAQLLLVGALALATIFLLLSVLLNSVIYTENLATRRTNVDADSAVTYRLDARRGVSDTVEYVNRNGDRSYADRYAEYEQLLDAWRGPRTNYSVSDGRYTNVTPVSGYEGTRIVDDNASTDMTAWNGSTTWTVAPDVKSRNLVVDVNVSAGLPSESAADVANILSSNSTGVFRVVVNDSSPTAVAVYNNSSTGDAQLLVYDYPTGEYSTCRVPAGRIDVFRGRADGDYCRPLTRVSPSGAYDVRFVDGGRANGTYALTVDRLEAPLRRSANEATNGDQCTAVYAPNATVTPYTTPAVYSTTVRLDFASTATTYRTDERVAPAERGPPPSDPRFVNLSVADDGAGDFTVTVNATDPDGALSTVQVELVGPSGTENATTTSITGGVPTTIPISGPDVSPYRVVTTVTDGVGHQRAVTEKHDTDGDAAGCPP